MHIEESTKTAGFTSGFCLFAFFTIPEKLAQKSAKNNKIRRKMRCITKRTKNQLLLTSFRQYSVCGLKNHKLE